MVEVSVIIPVHNAGEWLDECLQSVHDQTFAGSLELSAYNDASKDSSLEILEGWKSKLESRNIIMTISGHDSHSPRGVGFAKNRAVEQSSGEFLAFLDADDIMHKDRILKQYAAAKEHLRSIVGCKFHRIPEGSTARFTLWANRISPDQLYTQVYTSHGPTIIMPTWFCSRRVFEAVGSFDEGGKGVPEDLIFFYKHMENGGSLFRVEEDLLTYRYHQEAATFSVLEDTIWKLRVEFLEKHVLDKWTNFTIWNAGKQGRKLLRSLSEINRMKVSTFCDVDEKKIRKGVYVYEESQEKVKPRIPIVHFTHSTPPYIICVKLDLTSGSFEGNLQSLNLTEGEDYFHFN